MALTAKFINECVTPGLYPDGYANLYLSVRIGRKPMFVCRGRLAGKIKEVSIGPAREMTIPAARDRALKIITDIRNGIDPIKEKRNQRSAVSDTVTFKTCAEKLIESMRPGWKNVKHAQQWENTLTTYAYPTLGDLPVADITPTQCLEVIRTIWTTKTETAHRVLSRMRMVFDWAIASELRANANPCSSLPILLPKVKRQKRNQPSMPYPELPEFFASLTDTASNVALKFLIITCCRANEVIGMQAEEVDYENMVWVIPASRMKGDKEHRVPLLAEHIELLDSVCPERTGFVFKGKPKKKGSKASATLSDSAMLAILRKRELSYVVHGFRSTFRTWGSDETDFRPEILEMALAHTIPNAVERAYNRADLLAKRRELMQAWVNYVKQTACA